MRLVLARHGRSTANVAHILDSAPPGAPLDELGRQQAARLGERLAARPVRAVYASRAVRAQQTAAPVAAAHGLPVEILDGVQEVFVGDLEGRSDEAALEAFNAVYDAWSRGDLDARMSGGESARDLRGRYLPAVERIAGGAAGDVVLVSHGAAIRLAAAALLGDTAETFYVPNTGLVELRRADGEDTGWVLESWDAAEAVAGDVTAGGTPD